MTYNPRRSTRGVSSAGAVARWLLVALAGSGCAAVRPAAGGAAVGSAAAGPSIVQVGAPVLRERAPEVAPELLGTQELDALVARMVEAMRQAPGVGLAAPQLGVGRRVFVLEDKEDLMSSLTAQEREERARVPVPLRVFVNPVVRPVGDETATFFEGCLSVSGYAALVRRALEVEVDALDARGQKVHWRVRGWPARILQHEMDHLDGTLYIDRMHSRSFGTLPQVKERFGGKPIAKVLRELGL